MNASEPKAIKRIVAPSKPVFANGAAIGRNGAAGRNGAIPGPTKISPPGNVYKPECPAQKVLETIASKWAVLVMHSLLDGPMRFNALQRRLEGISQKVLTQQLRRLEKMGLVSRSVHATVPPSVEYALTDAGRDLKDALSGICAWANKHAGVLNAPGRTDSPVTAPRAAAR